MDVNLQDTADVEVEDLADEGDVETQTETEEEEEDEEPKRRRGKDRVWKEVASFPNKEQFRASEIHVELSAEMTRQNIYKGEDRHTHLYVCRYFKKHGWKRCHRAVRVEFSQTAFDIVVCETDDSHIHEEEPGFATPVNYHWTSEQCQVIRRHIQARSKRANLILRELRDKNLVNGAGLLPSKDQVACNDKKYLFSSII